MPPTMEGFSFSPEPVNLNPAMPPARRMLNSLRERFLISILKNSCVHLRPSRPLIQGVDGHRRPDLEIDTLCGPGRVFTRAAIGFWRFSVTSKQEELDYCFLLTGKLYEAPTVRSAPVHNRRRLLSDLRMGAFLSIHHRP